MEREDTAVDNGTDVTCILPPCTSCLLETLFPTICSFILFTFFYRGLWLSCWSNIAYDAYLVIGADKTMLDCFLWRPLTSPIF